MEVVAIVLGFFSIIATYLPLIKSHKWWIRIFDFPRIQIMSFGILALLLILVYAQETPFFLYLLAAIGITVIYQAVRIIKYTPFYSVQAKKSSSDKLDTMFSIMQSNVKMDNRNAEKFLSIIEKYKPDIVLINEPDFWWANELKVLDQHYPHFIKKPLENTYGMLLFSKFPLKDTAVNFLVKEDIPSIFATVALPGGGEFDLHCLHPEPPSPGSSTYERDTEILLVGKEVKKANRPAIVVGDLNDVAWSSTSKLFQKYSQMLDPREGRGMYNTYNVFFPLFRYPLDHFFYTNDFGLSGLKKLEKFGSDHFPILIKLTFEPHRDHMNKKP